MTQYHHPLFPEYMYIGKLHPNSIGSVTGIIAVSAFAHIFICMNALHKCFSKVPFAGGNFWLSAERLKIIHLAFFLKSLHCIFSQISRANNFFSTLQFFKNCLTQCCFEL